MITNKKVSNLDPYAIKHMEFVVNKSKNYTTIKSVIISLIVFALTVLINIPNFQELWKPIEELSRYSTVRSMHPVGPFSATPICFVPYPNPYATASFNVTLKQNDVAIPPMDSSQTLSKFPYMAQHIQQKNYVCFNLEGHSYGGPQENVLKATINGPYTVYIKTVTNQQIIYGKQPTISVYNVSIALKLTATMTRFFIYNNIVSVEPQYIAQISPLDQQPVFQLPVVGLTPVINYFILMNSINTPARRLDEYAQNVQDNFIYRQTLSQVIGKFFAWFSIFLLFFVYIIEPIVQFEFNLQLIKNRYTSTSLQNIEPGVLTYLKYKIASLFPKLLKQGVLIQAFQRIQKDMDLVGLLKKQTMMKRISKQLQFSQNSVDLFVPPFQDQQNQEKDLLEKEIQSQQQRRLFQSQIRLINRSQFQAEREQAPSFCLINFFTNCLKRLDGSQVRVGLVYRKGTPYGSIWSIILTLIGVGGLLSFLIISGTWNIKSGKVINSYYVQSGLQQQLQITINPQDLFFQVTVLSTTFVPTFKSYLMNSKGETLKQISFLSGPACNSLQQFFNQKTNGLIKAPAANLVNYCLKQSVTIHTKTKYDQTYLVINTLDRRFTPPKIPTTAGIVNLYMYFQNTYFRSNGQSFTQYQYKLQSQYSSKFPLKLYRIVQTQLLDNNGELHQTFNFLTVNQEVLFKQGGIGFHVSPIKNVQQDQTTTIWDIIDNSYGVSILFFQILIFKLAYAINLKVKRTQSNQGRQNERSNIINILANHDRLLYGTFRQQLNRIKYYFKENISMTNAKFA